MLQCFEHASSLSGALLQVRIHETFAEDTALIIVTRSTGCRQANCQVNVADSLLDWQCSRCGCVAFAPKVMEYAGSGDLRKQVGGGAMMSFQLTGHSDSQLVNERVEAGIRGRGGTAPYTYGKQEGVYE